MRNKVFQINAVVALLILFFALPAFADTGSTNPSIEKRFAAAEELYNKGVLAGAQQEFEDILDLVDPKNGSMRAEIEAYLAIIDIDLRKPNLKASYTRVENLYKESAKIWMVRMKYASYLIDEEEYAEAIPVYLMINERKLNREWRNEYNFKYGYASLRSGNGAKAEELFGRVVAVPYNAYTNPSYYYLAHISYMKRDFNKAIDLFGKIGIDPRFSALSSYYIMESKFMLKDYQYVVTEGEKAYSTMEGEHRNKSARLLSEAYFALNQTEKARYYFEQYSLTNKNLSRNDIYLAGMLAYSQNRHNDAIDALKQVTHGHADTLTQNALYHIGNCYLEVRNKVEAHRFFGEASKYSFDTTIREDALYNYAKLSFDLNSDISDFERYLRTYSPAETRFNEIQNYMASAYILNRDYKSAIEALSAIKNPSQKEIANLQKASLFRSIQLIDINSYREAIPIMENSLKAGNYNDELNDVTRFWLAEAYYRSGNYKRSAEINQSLVSKRSGTFRQSKDYPTAIYNLAYSHFKLQDFGQAENRFAEYLKIRGSLPYANEARARMGDSQFMQRKYQEAVTSFALVSGESSDLYRYSRFQMAIAQGLLGNDKLKIDYLNELAADKKSDYYPDILFELGRTLIQTGKGTEAQRIFYELRDLPGKHQYYTKSLLELGLIHLNRGENSQAIEYYKKVVEADPVSQDAQSAISGLESIYQQQGRAAEFLAYIDNIGLSSAKSSDQRETILFNSAENLFLSGDYTTAINSLKSFLETYPNGEKSAQAHFYLGESYVKTNRPELALDSFRKVMEQSEGSFAELATLSYAKISYQLEQYDEAAKAYSSLSKIAKLENNVKGALFGRMNSLYMNREFENAIIEAEKAKSHALPGEESRRIEYVMAKSYYMLGKREQAMPHLTNLSKDKLTSEGAEATYLIISDYFDKGDYTNVESLTYTFSESGTPQAYWLARSFILLGDTFAERGNWEQAKATFSSILESYKPAQRDDVLEQVELRMAKLQEVSAETE